MPLKLYKRKDSKVWWIRGAVHGSSVYESTGSHDKEIAEALRIKREAQLVSDFVYGPKATKTFIEAASSYEKADGDVRFLGKVRDNGNTLTGLIGQFHDRILNTITQNDLDEAARTLYPTAQPETRNRQCYTPFIAVWNHAEKNGWCDKRSWSRPKKPKGTNVVRLTKQRAGAFPVEYDHASVFISKMSPAPAMLLTFLFYTGLRPIEAFALDVSSVDLKKRWLVVEKSKTGERRGVPIHWWLAEWLPDLVARGDRLFRTTKGRPYEDIITDEEGRGGGGMKTAIMRTRKRSGIYDISPYTARHSCSTALVVAGVHPHIKDQILGHAADDMSRHYTNVPQAPLIEAIDKLPVPSGFRDLPWVASPKDWWSKLAEGTGKRNDLTANRKNSA